MGTAALVVSGDCLLLVGEKIAAFQLVAWGIAGKVAHFAAVGRGGGVDQLNFLDRLAHCIYCSVF